MAQPTTGVFFNTTTPAAPPGAQNITFQTDGAQPEQSITATVPQATTALLGTVKPDGTSITIDPDGTIHAVATGGGDGGTGTGTSSSGGLEVVVVPSGEKDGSNTLYTLPAPVLAGAAPKYVTNGVVERQLGTEATFAVQGTQITRKYPLQKTDWHEFYYIQGTPNSESGGGGSVTPTTPGQFVQGAVNYTDAPASNSVSFPSANTAGNCLIVDMVMVENFFGGFGTCSVSDSQGNSYSTIISQEQNNVLAISWVALNCAGGANTVTVAYTGGGGAPINVAIHEYTGVATASAVDASAFTQNASPGLSPLSVSVTTTVAGDLLHLFAGCIINWPNTPCPFTESGGWTQRELSSPTSTGTPTFVPSLSTWDIAAGAAGSYSDTISSNSPSYLSCYVIALKP